MTSEEKERDDNDDDDDNVLPLPIDREWITKLLHRFPNSQSRHQKKALIVAPMVDQSDLPFRLLCRKYGSNLCFTPMIHSGLVIRSIPYRKKFTGKWLDDLDRPLIAQLCGSDPDTMLKAARLIEPYVDGIDINCGCPQGIAKRGNYGAYLLEQEETLLTLVKHLVKYLHVPLSVKVRLLPDPEVNPHKIRLTGDGGEDAFDIPAASLDLYGKLVDAGIHLLTIHGRTRKQKQDLTGKADWDTIAKAVKLYGHRIPIFANGSIESYEDVEECLNITNVDGVMSSEALLEYPPIFYKIPQTPKRTIGRLQLAREYIELAQQYPPNEGGQGSGIKCIRMHLHRFFHKDMQEDISFRQKVIEDKTVSALAECIEICRQKHLRENHSIEGEKLSWYRRHRDERETVARLQSQRKQQLLLQNKNGKDDNTDGYDDDDDDESIQECGNFFSVDNNEEKGDY